MNSYEQRQVDRRQRLEDAARKANAEAARRLDTAHEIGSHIPFGQPIMVGHHSEKRHRGDIERIDNNMRKGVGKPPAWVLVESAATTRRP
jgi:hypothetical protein